MKKKTMTIGLLLLAVVLTSLVMTAQAASGGGGSSFSILEDLNLTEKQKAQVEAVMKANQVKMKPANKEYEQARDALDKATENGTDKEILAAAGTLSETIKKRSIIMAEYTQAINKILTPEQRAEKKKKYAEFERQRALRAKERQKRMQAMEARRTSGSRTSSSSSSDIVSITQLELDLTVEQLSKIIAIEMVAQEKLSAPEKATDQARTALRKATEIGNEEKILAAVKELGTAYGDQALIKAQVIRDTKEVLTPEQRAEREKQLAEIEKQKALRAKEWEKRIQALKATGQTSGSSSGGGMQRGTGRR